MRKVYGICKRVSPATVLRLCFRRSSANFCSSFTGLERKISTNHRDCFRSPESSELSRWTPSKELRDSLVDMYTDNPDVNEELRQRLPSPGRRPLSPPVHGSPLEPSDKLEVPRGPPEASSSSVGTSYPASSGTSASGADMATAPPAGGRLSPGPETCERPPSPAAEGLVVSSSVQDVATGQTASYGRAPPPDGDKQVSLLLREMDALRDANKKLLERLILKEEELQRKEAELMADAKPAEGWQAPSDFLDELLSARKDRDEAMMSRVLLANQERDEALSHVARLQQAARREASGGPSLGDDDPEAEELLRRICRAASAREVSDLGRALLERLRRAWRRRRDLAAQEMKVVMEQRDGALAQCRRLRREAARERERGPSEEELAGLRREREGSERPEAGPERSPDAGTPREPRPEAPPAAGDAPLLARLRRLAADKRKVEAELQRCQEAERDAGEKVRRLERLVEVLRKKAGAGSARPVV